MHLFLINSITTSSEAVLLNLANIQCAACVIRQLKVPKTDVVFDFVYIRIMECYLVVQRIRD